MSLNNLGLGFTVSAEDTASAVFSTVGGNLGKLEKKGKEVGASIEEVSGKITGMGVALTGFGAAGLAGLGLASGAASKFGASIAEVSTLVDATAFSVDQMRDSTFAMGAAFGGELSDQVRAMYQGISAGASDAASNQALLTQANRLAIAGVTDVRTAVDGLTNVLNAYGKTYTDQNLTAVSDAFFVALKGGKTTAAELASTLGKLAPVTNAVGISIDEMLAGVSSITTKGIQTSEAVAGMKAALAGVLKPTKDASDEAARLGVSFDAATLRAMGLPKFLDSITSSANFNADSFSKLFGSVEGLNAILALTSNDAATFNAMLTQMASKSGQTAAALAKMEATAEHQLAMNKALRQSTGILIGEAIAPLVTLLVKGMNAIMRTFINMPAPMRKLIVGLFALASVLAVVVGGALLLAGAIAGVIAAKAALVTALTAVAAGFAFLLQVMLPVLLIGGALFLLWQRNAGGFRDVVTGALHKVSLAFKALGQLLSTGQLSGAVLTELNTSQQGVKAFAIQVFLWINRVKNFFSGIGEGFDAAMARAKPTVDAFVGTLRRIGAMFGMTADRPDAAAKKFHAWGAAGARVGNIIGSVVELVVKGMGLAARVVEGAVRAFNFFWPAVSKTWDAVQGFFGAIMELVGAIVGVGSSTQSAGGFFEVFGAILGGVASAIAMVLNAFITLSSMTISVFSGLIMSIRAFVVFGIELIGGFLSLVKALLTGDWAGAWEAAKGIVFAWAKAVVGIIAGVVLAVAGAVDKLGKAFGKDFGLRDKVAGIQADITAGIGKALGAGQAPATGPAALGAPRPGAPAVATPAPALGGPAAGTVAPPATVANSPGVAAGAGQAGLAEAVQSLAAQQAKPPPPLNATIHVPVQLDGQVVADVVAKYQGDGRGFGPTEAPA